MFCSYIHTKQSLLYENKNEIKLNLYIYSKSLAHVKLICNIILLFLKTISRDFLKIILETKQLEYMHFYTPYKLTSEVQGTTKL